MWKLPALLLAVTLSFLSNSFLLAIWHINIYDLDFGVYFTWKVCGDPGEPTGDQSNHFLQAWLKQSSP